MHRRILTGLVAVAVSGGTLALPAVSLASSGTNPTTNDAIGWCVSAGNYNYHQAGTTTGADRSSYAGTPGAVAGLIAGARTWCAANQSPYPPPGQPS